LISVNNFEILSGYFFRSDQILITAQASSSTQDQYSREQEES